MASFNNSIPEISIDGFKVVSGKMFAHLPRKGEPTCTLWNNSISFIDIPNKACQSKKDVI